MPLHRIGQLVPPHESAPPDAANPPRIPSDFIPAPAGVLLAVELNRTMVLPHLLLDGSNLGIESAPDGDDVGSVVPFG